MHNDSGFYIYNLEKKSYFVDYAIWYVFISLSDMKKKKT